MLAETTLIHAQKNKGRHITFKVLFCKLMFYTFKGPHIRHHALDSRAGVGAGPALRSRLTPPPLYLQAATALLLRTISPGNFCFGQ